MNPQEKSAVDYPRDSKIIPCPGLLGQAWFTSGILW